MLNYEQDPDVVRWGLQLFGTDPYFNCAYSETVVHDHESHYRQGYFKEENYETDYRIFENDEIIAHALQEELSKLTISGESKATDEEIEDLQVSVALQDWVEQSNRNYGSGHENGQEGEDDMGPSSPCSSTKEKSYCRDEWLSSLELTDGYSFDGELEKRLNQMVPIPHVPRIVGEIPSIDEATLDHQRLLERLELFGLVEHKVQGDGNCQFRALSDQLYRTPEHHEFVRQQVVNQLKSDPEIYEAYVPMDFDDYLEKMSGSGEWGDHVTLQAAADSYGVKLLVLTSFKDTCYIEILPHVERSTRVICLSFWAEVHYNSIYSKGGGDLPTFETKEKKRQWILQSDDEESEDEY